LRAALVAAVSAIDRYFHDIVVEHAWALLSKKEDDVPKELQKLSIPVLEAKKALAKLHSDRSSRPGYIVKKAIQDVLYRQTFQNPDDIARAGQMLGIKDFWRKVAGKISGGSTSERVTASLRALARRRNQIVHEADLIRKTKAKKTTLRDITEKEAADWINWTEQFIAAVHATVST
jgi:restriction system protein